MNQYAYRLEGIDKDWIYCGKRRYASYTNIGPGEYLFRVKGTNNDGVWNKEGTSLKLIITPPFWMTTWFRLLIGVTLIAGLVAVYKIRVSRLEKEKKNQQAFSRRLIEEVEKGRKSIAGELHDSLGQNLLIVKNEIQQVITKLSTKKQTNDDLNEISSLVTESINEVRELSTDLHPHQLDRLGLKKAIESVIHKCAHSSDIEFLTEIEEIDDIFPKNLEIHVFRIIQEGLSNIMKHAEATIANIHVPH